MKRLRCVGVLATGLLAMLFAGCNKEPVAPNAAGSPSAAQKKAAEEDPNDIMKKGY